MTKAEIIDSVYERVGGFSKKEAAEIVEAVFDAMKDVLAEGEKIKISGFGNFVVRAKKRRTGRNPQTGEPISISARRVLTFKASQVLKNVLNPSTSAASASPSTSAPAPSAPATSAPTTSVASTSVASTSAPSTSAPTTSAPTTSVASTSAPSGAATPGASPAPSSGLAPAPSTGAPSHGARTIPSGGHEPGST